MKHSIKDSESSPIVPTGLLKRLVVSQIKPSQNNPRQLFDPEPLKDLKESILQHGVLVPITVYQIKGQDKYAILDGERRFRCCQLLEEEGKEISIPANVVEPPTKVAGLLYMFSIHNFREQWELMPTALSLQTVMEELKEQDNKRLSKLTGLSETSIDRCKILLTFPEQFQTLSLLSDPKERIPSNFWIEAFPVIKIYENKLGELIKEWGRDVLITKLVQKYKDKKIASVIHFRRIVEASRRSEEKQQAEDFVARLKEYIQDPQLETRAAFDEFLPARNITGAVKACEDFIHRLQNLETQLITENDTELIDKLKNTQKYISSLLEQMNGNLPKANDE